MSVLISLLVSNRVVSTSCSFLQRLRFFLVSFDSSHDLFVGVSLLLAQKGLCSELIYLAA